jgi:peptidoglycan/LPS O-acetylase OafA/YrhL
LRGRAAAADEAVVTPHFPHLDSLRALAVIALIAYDVAWGGARVDARFAPIAERLNVVALPMFMVLSGFLLYRPFLAARRWGVPEPRLRDFAAGRALRIVPAYWVALIVITIAASLPGDVLGGRFWVYFGFLQTYADWNGLQGLSHAWTVTLAVSFYVFLALWVLVFRGRGFSLRRELLLTGLLAAGSLFLQAQYQVTQGRWGNLDLTLPALLFAFSAGMALAALSVAVEGRQRRSLLVRAVSRNPSLCWLLALAVYALLCYGLGLPHRGASISEYTTATWVLEQGLGAVVAVLVLVPVILGDNVRSGVPQTVLSSPVLLGIGRVAFGIYLWHVAVLAWVQTVFMPRRSWDSLGLELLLTVSVSALIAWVSWAIVEKPFIQLRQRSAAAPKPDHPGDDQGRHAGADHPDRGPSRPLGVAWQDHVALHLGGQQGGAAARATAVGPAPGNPLGGAGATLAVHRHQLGGGAGGGEQVAVAQPGAGQVGGTHLEQAAGARHVDPAPAPGEAGRDHRQPRDRSADRG